jgi:hypothetical protein
MHRRFWGSCERASCYIPIIKPTRCTNFSNLFLEWNSTCFGQFHCPSSGVFHCTHSNGICHTGLLTACEQAVSKPVWHIPLPCVRWKPPDDGERNCPKHEEFHFKNKFEKLVHLVGFIIRKHTDNVTKMIKIRLYGKQCGQKTYSCCYHHDAHLGGWGWQ